MIEALAPTTPTYRLLRQALKDARAGGGTTAAPRMREIAVNLERERWLPRRLPADRVWVNAADERLVLYRDDRPIFSTRAIVGQDDVRNQSPELKSRSRPSGSIRPGTSRMTSPPRRSCPRPVSTRRHLAKRNIVMLPDGSLQQRAGANSGLGQLIFDMRNQFDVYLHDTRASICSASTAAASDHGCIRVENPRQLAALLMREPIRFNQ